MVQPAFSSARRLDGTGPMPMIEGSTPADAQLLMLPRMVAPRFSASSRLIRTSAAAPSLRPDALAAVTVPSFLNARSEEHTSELQSLMRISYAVFCLKKKNKTHSTQYTDQTSSTTN